MQGMDGLRSQTIGILKVALPLAALGLLSTIFLIARAPVKDGSIPYAEINEIAREPRVSGAQISGVAADGSVIELNAAIARPEGSLIHIETLSADIETAEGVSIAIRAGTGEVDNETQIARLSGLARVETSNGYTMETAGVTADMASGRITSDGALEVHTPFGEMTAGQLIIEMGTDGAGQRMLFQDGVRLIYHPQQRIE